MLEKRAEQYPRERKPFGSEGEQTNNKNVQKRERKQGLTTK